MGIWTGKYTSCVGNVCVHLFLRSTGVEGVSDLLVPDVLSGVSEDIISGKIRAERSHPIIGDQGLGLDADMWSRN